jgi:hypothetical protein
MTGAISPFPPTWLYGVHRGGFTLYISGERTRVLKCIGDRFKTIRCGYMGGKEILGQS